MKIEIEISETTAALISRFTNATQDEANDHGRLTIKTLAHMLLCDVAIMVRRPGCWEAESMRALLASHGYEDATYATPHRER